MSRRNSFSKENFHSMIKEFDESVHRSTQIASNIHQINQMQSREIQQIQENLDRTDENLENVEKQIEEIHRSFCCQLCCSSKSTKKKRTNRSNRSTRQKNFLPEQNSILLDDQLKIIDENLQRMQHFNRLIDEEIHDQIQRLNFIENQVDGKTSRLEKINASTKDLV